MAQFQTIFNDKTGCDFRTLDEHMFSKILSGFQVNLLQQSLILNIAIQARRQIIMIASSPSIYISLYFETDIIPSTSRPYSNLERDVWRRNLCCKGQELRRGGRILKILSRARFISPIGLCSFIKFMKILP